MTTLKTYDQSSIITLQPLHHENPYYTIRLFPVLRFCYPRYTWYVFDTVESEKYRQLTTVGVDSNIVQRGTPTVRDATSVQETISLCTQYAYYAANGYEVLNNLWGKDSATSGSQCTYYEGASGSGIKWSSTWTWQGGENNVKSYAYAGRQLTKGNTIAKIKNMPTQVNWSYNTTSNVRANVAYDLFTSTDPNHANSSGDYELMIWYIYAPRRTSLSKFT